MDSANVNLIKLPEYCKAPEYKLGYFLQKKPCSYKYVFQTSSNFSKKFKQITVEEKLCQL